MAGERDDQQLRVRDLRGDARARRRSACAGPARRRGSASARRAAGPTRGGRGEASGQPAHTGTRLVLERGARVERVEVARRAAPRSARERFVQARLRGAASAARGRASLRRGVAGTAFRRSTPSFRRRRAAAGRSGSGPRRAAAAAAAGRGRARSADTTAAGSSARSAGFRSPASTIPSRSRLVERHRVAVARPVVDRAAERVLAQPRRSACEVGERVGGDPARRHRSRTARSVRRRSPGRSPPRTVPGRPGGTTESSTSASTCWG